MYTILILLCWLTLSAVADAAVWYYRPATLPSAFAASGAGGNAGYCAELEDFDYLPTVWNELTDSASSGGATLEALEQYGAQIGATLNLPTGTYYAWVLGRCTQGQNCTVWLQHGTPFGAVPSNQMASKFTPGIPRHLIPIGHRADENLQRPPSSGDTAQRALSITNGQAIYLLADAGVDLDYVFLATSATAVPSCSGGDPEPTAEYVIKELGANSVTVNGSAEAFWTQANVVLMAGTATDPAPSSTWVTRLAWSDSLNRLYFLSTATVANLAASLATAHDQSDILSQNTRVELLLRFADLVKVADASTYKVACDIGSFVYDANYPSATVTPSYDFTRACTATYAANTLTIEGYIQPTETLTANQFLLMTGLIYQKATSVTGAYRYWRGSSIGVSQMMIAQVSSTVMQPPADTTAPTVGNASVANITATSADVSFTCTDAGSPPCLCGVEYDGDNDGTVAGTDLVFVQGLAALSGTCTVALVDLVASENWEVKGWASDGSGNVARSAAVTDFSTLAAGTVKYLSPTGSDAAAGDSGTPWRTFAYALDRTRMLPGMTLILKDGVYNDTDDPTIGGVDINGFPNLNCTTTGNANNGTAAQRITIRAENERMAHLKGTGAVNTMFLSDCHYWTIEGLRISSADNNAGSGGHVILARNSTNMIWRRLLLHHNNRERNTHLMWIDGGSVHRVEDSEFYSFHRHAIDINSSNGNLITRNYFNSRAHADIPGGYVSGYYTTGDDGVTVYPGSSNLVQNNISEGNGNLFSIQATTSSQQNALLGSISFGDKYGVLIKARGSTTTKMPTNNTVRNTVVINASSVGVYLRGSKGNTVQQVTTMGAMDGMIADYEAGQPGDGNYSFTLLDSLVMNSSRYGVRAVSQDTWSVDYVDSVGNATNFSPAATDPNITHELTTDPVLGTAQICIPTTSPVRTAGTGGIRIGAEVLYRYEGGVLTSQPLWIQTKPASCPTSVSGWYLYGQGACITGVNETLSTSAIGVADRVIATSATQVTTVLNACAADGSY